LSSDAQISLQKQRHIKARQPKTSKGQQIPPITGTKDNKEKRSPKNSKNMIIKMLNEMKEDMYKKLNEFKDTNEKLKSE
jgi:hypothetical protein